MRHHQMPGHFCLTRITVFFVVAAVVISCGERQAREAPAAINLDPDVIIGSLDGSNEYLFAWINALAADTAGNVYVAERNAYSIRKFDRSGRFVREYGRRGEGPGEFLSIRSLAVSHGRIFAYDKGLRRITIIDNATGQVINDIPVATARASARYANAGHIRILDDTLMAVGVAVNTGLPSSGRPYDEQLRVYSLGGQLVSSVMIPNRAQAIWRFPSRARNRMMVFPYSPWYVWTINPSGGATFGWGGEYRIYETLRSADTTRIYRRDADPVIPDELTIHYAERWVDTVLALGGARPEAYRRPIQNESLQFVALAYSPDGKQLWVRRSFVAARPIYDIFEPVRQS